MIGRTIPGILVVVAALLLMPGLTVPEAAAQDATGRFRVLIPDFFPAEGTKRGYGKDVADKLREQMDELATHEAIEKDELKDELKRFDIKMEELNCLRTRQLGSQINAQVAMCVEYEDLGDDQMRVMPEVWDLNSSSSFTLESFVMDDGDKDEAAQRILEDFDTFIQAVRIRDFCFRYAAEGAYEDALRNCNQALEMNPDDLGVVKQRARVLFEQSKSGPEDDPTYDPALLEEAYEAIQVVVEADPLDDDALALAGFMATKLGMEEEGRSLYRRYLELNPGDVGVRRNIAYEMFDAGDPEGAMLFIEEGLEVESNPDLLVDFGNYAFALAAQRAQASATEGISPEVAEIYREALDAYMEAFEAKGEEMSVSALRNVVNAYIQLDQVEDAIQVADRILEVHPEEAGIWWAYAQALNRAGRTDEAMDALDEVAEIDPNYPDLYAIQGRWLLDDGRLDDAMEKLEQAAERGRDPNWVAYLVFADAHAIGTDDKNFGEAIRYLQAAKSFDVSSEREQEFDFWHAYFLMQQAIAQQEPQTVETARATLPKFERARSLFESARAHAEQNPNLKLGDMLNATNTYIEIQEAIIKRAGGI